MPKPTVPAASAEAQVEALKRLERTANRRGRAALGASAILLGVFLLRPSWTMAFFLLVVLIIVQSVPHPSLNLCITSGLPYGKKIAPVALARKPWWQVLLFPLHPNMRSLWTGVVSTKPHLQTRRLQMIGRVRALLVADVWFLQCGEPELGWRIDVRAPLDSPLWRTCYTCPALGAATVPPPTADGMWRSTMPRSERRADDEPLRIELPEMAQAWFRGREGHQQLRKVR